MLGGPGCAKSTPPNLGANFPIKVNKCGAGLVHAASLTVGDGTPARL